MAGYSKFTTLMRSNHQVENPLEGEVMAYLPQMVHLSFELCSLLSWT